LRRQHRRILAAAVDQQQRITLTSNVDGDSRPPHQHPLSDHGDIIPLSAVTRKFAETAR
jgi:hypothetical protein